MAELPFENRYCMDTSALIDMHKNYYKNVFVSLWKEMDKIAEESALLAPKEVYNELLRFAV